MPSLSMTCQQEHEYRMYKCEKLFALRDVVDGRTQECLRRLAVYPGLPVNERANVWKLFFKLRTPMKETWAFADAQRSEAYDSLLEASCVKENDEHDDFIKVFMFYAAMDGSRSATAHGPTYSPSSVCYPGSALSSADLESIRAMCAVLKQALIHDYQVFWGLVMLTNQLNRIAVSQSGTILQRYSVSHRVMAFSKRLAVVDPDLSRLLEQKLGIIPSVYADKWFRSLFALAFGEKRIDAVVRLWDALIASPFELVVHVAVHFVLKMKEPIQAIVACNHEPAEVLTTQVVTVLETLPNIDKSALDEILYTIWQGTDTLFRGSTERRDLDHRISFLVEWPVVKRGAVNSSIVRILQFLLRARGLGSIFFVDGTYGSRTANMVKRFRENMKLRLCEQRDCAFPLGDNASDIEEGNIVGPELWPHLIEPLEYNSKRSFAVKALQTALIDLHGCNCVRADGYFGKITLEAVQDFQSDYAANRIDVDGVAGELTWLHLLGCLPGPDHYER